MGQRYFRETDRKPSIQGIFLFITLFFTSTAFAVSLPQPSLIFTHHPIDNKLNLLQFDPATMRTQVVWSKVAGFLTPFSLDRFATIFDQDGKPVLFADDITGGVYRVDDQKMNLLRLKTLSTSLKIHPYKRNTVVVSDEFNRIISLDSQGNETPIDDGKRIPAAMHGALSWLTFVNDDRYVAITQQLLLFDLKLHSTSSNLIKLTSYDFSPLDKHRGKFRISAVRGIAGSGDLLWIVLDGYGIPTNNDRNRILALIKLSNGTVLKKLSLTKVDFSQALPDCHIASFDSATMNIILQNGDTLVEAHQDGSHQHFMKGQFHSDGLSAYGVPLSFGSVRFLRTSATNYTEINTDSVDLENPLSEAAFFLLIKKENIALEQRQGRPLPELPTKLQFTSWLRGTNQLKYFFEDFYHYSNEPNKNNVVFARELNQTLHNELMSLGYVLQAGILAPRTVSDEDSGADLGNLFALLVKARHLKRSCEGLITP